MLTRVNTALRPECQFLLEQLLLISGKVLLLPLLLFLPCFWLRANLYRLSWISVICVNQRLRRRCLCFCFCRWLIAICQLLLLSAVSTDGAAIFNLTNE